MRHLATGLAVALQAQNLLFALIGVLVGSLIGVLPGLAPVAAIAMLLPAVHALALTPALIMLAGVYYGAQYGGSTGAILVVNAPPEASAAMTALDGLQLARQGRAGAALGVAALSSFVAGCVGAALIALLVPLLTALATQFGPAEYFSLMVLGLVGAVVLASGSLTKSIAMVVLGLLLSGFNADIVAGTATIGLELPELHEGVGFVVIAISVFGLADIVAQLEQPNARRELLRQELTGLWPTRRDLREAWPAVLRGTLLGALLGLLPGGGTRLASFAAYAVERQLAGTTSRLGKGDLRGVAGPESANHAGAQTSFIPLLAWGIPSNAAMALMVGAMTIKGVAPGPQVMTDQPQLFWGLIVSMWIGNVILVVLNLPLVGLWARLLRVPYGLVFPALTLASCIGVYALKGSSIDIYLAALCTIAGYGLHKLDCEVAPLLLGFILGPTMEENMRRTFDLAGGGWNAFIHRPISAGLLAAAALVIVIVLLPSISQRRETTFQED